VGLQSRRHPIFLVFGRDSCRTPSLLSVCFLTTALWYGTLSAKEPYNTRNGTSFCVFFIDSSRAPSLFRQQEISHHVSESLFPQISPMIRDSFRKRALSYTQQKISCSLWTDSSHLSPGSRKSLTKSWEILSVKEPYIWETLFAKEPYNTCKRIPFFLIDISTLFRPLEISHQVMGYFRLPLLRCDSLRTPCVL